MSEAAEKTDTGAATSVRQRLIDAGERLFAEHGWEGVGIRAIAAAAGVSLAALNYHFGDKEKLLAAIFAQRAEPIAAERMRLLAAMRAGGGMTVEGVIRSFLQPVLGAWSESRSGSRDFGVLRARLAAEPEAFKDRVRAQTFDESTRAYMAALGELLPELSREELGMRFHFLLGSMLYTISDPGRIRALSDGHCDPGDVATVLLHMVPFLAAGFRSPPLPRGSPAASEQKH